MREIKVRVWDDESKVFVYSGKEGETKSSSDYFFYWDNDTGGLQVFAEDDDPEDISKGACRELKDKEEYTGLRDKNGKEIYEGDIIRVTEKYCCLSPEQVEVVMLGGDDEWPIPGFCPFIDTNNIEEQEWMMAWSKGIVEVIGNKWENPELLCGEK